MSSTEGTNKPTTNQVIRFKIFTIKYCGVFFDDVEARPAGKRVSIFALTGNTGVI